MSEQTHRLESVFEPRLTHSFRIKMQNNSIFVAKEIYQLDKSIYGLNGGWSGVVVSSENLSPSKERLFRAGSGIDFYEDDILEIFDETTHELIYRKGQ